MTDAGASGLLADGAGGAAKSIPRHERAHAWRGEILKGH